MAEVEGNWHRITCITVIKNELLLVHSIGSLVDALSDRAY